MKTSEVLAKQIENPGRREMRKILESDTTGPRNLLRGVGVVAAAPYFAAKDMLGTKLSDEDKAELKREVRRGNKGEDPEYKKGGAVKGWGKARGARKAKMY